MEPTFRQCPHCPKAFKSARYYNDHLRIHTGEKPYKCPRCSYASNQSGNLGQHLRRFGNFQPVECALCNNFISCSPKGLNIHVEQVHRRNEKYGKNNHEFEYEDDEHPPILEAQTYTLDPNDLPDESLYFTEVEDVEPMEENDDDSNKEDEIERGASPEIVIEAVYSVKEEAKNRYHCPHCNYSTEDVGDLGRHIRAKQDWTFQCQDCEFSSCTSQGILSHRDEAHYGERPELGEEEEENPEVQQEKYEDENEDSEEAPPEAEGGEAVEGQIFKCHNCAYTATTEWTLIRHQRQTKGPPFKCTQCEYTSCSDYVLRRHEKTCNGVTPSESVPEEGSSPVVVRKGNKWKQGKIRQKILQKKMQEKIQNQNKFLQRKVQSPFQNEKKHVCPYCRKLFRKNHLTDHLRIHTGERPYKCDKCCFAGAQPSSLSQHKARKENHDPPLQCTECPFTSCNSVFLRKHVTECHSNTLNIPKVPASVKNLPELVVTEVPKKIAPKIEPEIHNCSLCGYSNSNKSKLTRHMAIHFDNKPYQCRYCTYRCRNSTDMKTHERTHTGERPYKCALCPAAFAQAGAFAKHRRTHHGENSNGVPLQNPPEPKVNMKKVEAMTGDHFLAGTFLLEPVMATAALPPPAEPVQNQNQVEAQRIVSDVETYFKCEYCEYQSKSKPDVVRHIRIHTGEKPYQCSICPFRSARSYDVKRHALTRHFGQPR